MAVNPAAVFNIRRTFAGVTISESVNLAVSLVAAAEYVFDTVVDKGETINFQAATGTTIVRLDIVELDGMSS